MRKQRSISIPTVIIAAAVLFAVAGCRHETQTPATVAAFSQPAAVSADTCEAAIPADTVAALPAGRRPDMCKRVLKGGTLVLETDGMRLVATGDAVKHGGVYSVTALSASELPPLPQGMVDMTAFAAGYRLLPGGDHFSPAAELRIAYDPALLPTGYSADDIHTSYYDSAACAWVRLERVGVDTARHEIVSLTTHFTDFINELLKACELLNQPLHTVYIGSSASNVMEQLAKCTGGEQITVSSAKEIKDNVIEIFQHFLLAEGGRFTFAQMLRKCRIDGCAVALYNYAKRLTQSTHTRMGDIITHYGYGPGISEWFRVAQPSCHIRQSAPSSSTNNYLQLTVDAGSDTQQALDEKLREWRVPHKSVLSADTDIDMTAIVFSYGYVRLQDFLWACFEIDDKTINHKDELAAVMQKDYPIINIYGKDIEKL